MHIFLLKKKKNCTTVITPENVITLIALYCRPYCALSELRKGMLGANPELWLECPYFHASVERRIVHNSSQSTAFDYLRRLILVNLVWTFVIHHRVPPLLLNDTKGV